MSIDGNVSKSWREELASLLDDTGIRHADAGRGITTPEPGMELSSTDFVGGESESLKDQIKEFLKASGELLVDLSRGCRDIVQQSLEKEDSFVVRKFGGPYAKVCGKLRFLNDFLPEDRDPAHAWPAVFLVFILALAVLNVNSERNAPAPLVKKVLVHPPNASRIVLQDGRHVAYREQGVPAERARFTVIAPHSFLSSRLAGIPGLKASLLEEFGVRLITYDLPGFGESDSHLNRNLESSALDMLQLANNVGVHDKFWVMGHSTGAMHAWATLRYIPDRIAGAAMFAPLVNPYEPTMTKEERSGTWENWTRKRKLMYFLARRFPRFLAYFYHRSFLSGTHGHIDEWLSVSLGKWDKALVEELEFEEFWQRDVEESVRQGNIRPFLGEAILQVNWGFSVADLKIKNKGEVKGLVHWLKSMYNKDKQEQIGFLGPIHIWQGMDDRVVPPSMADFLHRVLPGVTVHKLANEGHFSYLYFCETCHRQIFTTLFGTPQGPLNFAIEEDVLPVEGDKE